MGPSFTLVDLFALRDLQVFLSRAARVDEGSVRLIAGNGVLAVYVAVLYPVGLLDESPTVLGLRTFAVVGTDDFDAVVPVRSLIERVNRLESTATDDAAPVSVSLPMQVHTVTWTAISPPRGGWVRLPETDRQLLEFTARSGIEEVAASIPTGTGEQIVRRVRSEVWGRPVEGLDYVPAGGAFAALSLGFFGDADEDRAVQVYESGPWTRLTTRRGHVLVKRRAWTLAR